MTIEDMFRAGCNTLSEQHIENPSLNVGLILEEITGIKRLSLPLSYGKVLDNEQVSEFQEMLMRRGNKEPLQYILGYTEFYGNKINVTPDVLIPRPETEFLIETIHENIKKPKRIIDIGTGSGAIAISLKKLFPEAEVIAVDISPQALKLAKANALQNKVQIRFVQADIYTEDLGEFDLIASNPPYVTEEEYSELPAEVQQFEPKLALVGSEAGLYFYRKIIELSTRILSPKGTIFFEIGETQALTITKIAKMNGYVNVQIILDLVGKERILRIEN